MEGRYDLLITADRNICAQQNISGRNICILVPQPGAGMSWLWVIKSWKWWLVCPLALMSSLKGLK
jgi:hypothetical protein